MTQSATLRPVTDETAETGTGPEAPAEETQPASGAASQRPYLILKALPVQEQDAPDEGVEVAKPAMRYEHLATITTSSDKTAVRRAAETHGPGQYVAVAEGSWHEHNPRIEQTAPRIVF